MDLHLHHLVFISEQLIKNRCTVCRAVAPATFIRRSLKHMRGGKADHIIRQYANWCCDDTCFSAGCSRAESGLSTTSYSRWSHSWSQLSLFGPLRFWTSGAIKTHFLEQEEQRMYTSLRTHRYYTVLSVVPVSTPFSFGKLINTVQQRKE